MNLVFSGQFGDNLTPEALDKWSASHLDEDGDHLETYEPISFDRTGRQAADRTRREIADRKNALLSAMERQGVMPVGIRTPQWEWDAKGRGGRNALETALTNLTNPHRHKDVLSAAREILVNGEALWASHLNAKERQEKIGADMRAGKIPGPQAPPPIEMAPARMLRKLSGWMREFTLPEYLWDGILIKRFCYSLTAQTGAGKTAAAMLLAVHTALGKSLCGRDIEAGTVIYLAGENPTDVQMRFLGLCHLMGIDWDTLDIHVIAGAMDISKHTEQVRAECEADGLKPALVVVDTAAAYFGGDNDNDNVQMGNYGRQLRGDLCTLPGEPCVLILAHPTKGAKDMGEMVPRGGGAFINEVDGNLGAVRDGNLIGIQSVGKFRGPEFSPLHFGLHVVHDTPALFDPKKGKHIPTVVAQAVSEAGAAARAVERETTDIRLVRFIDANPKASFAQIAAEFGANKSRAERMVNSLISDKLVKRDKLTGKLTLTPAAQSSLNNLDFDQKHGEAAMVPFPGIPGPRIA